LTVLEDRTLPSFAAPVAVDLGGAANAVAAAHLEGNKAPLDVVTADSNGTVSVLLGNGDGTLQNPINLHVGSSLTSVAVGDFLGNGLQDIVAADANGTIELLLSNGNGTFGAVRTFNVGATPKGVAVGDFLGNGRLDVVTANSNGTVSVLPGNGDGTFGAPLTSTVGGRLTSVAVGEFNGDGKPDLVVGTDTGLSVLLGNGDGTFTVKSTIPFLVAPSMPDITVPVTSVAVGDFRSDGKQDIVANGSGNLAVLLGNGDGTFTSPATLAVGAAVASQVVGDFTGDGKLDIVTSNFAPSSTSEPTLSVLVGNGDGTFGAATSQIVGTAANALAAGDFRGDGKLDLALAAGNSVTALLGNGDGTFVTTPSFSTGLFLPSAIAAGDFNGDGKPDLVTTGLGDVDVGDAVVLLNNGDGTFRTGPTLPLSDSPSAVVVGDFTGNSHQDVAVAIGGGQIDVFLGNGDGTFVATPLVVDVGSNNSIQMLVAGDFNGDGKLDLAAASTLLSGQTQTGLVTVLLGNGDGTFRVQPAINVGTSASALAVADLNGDGRLDLVATSRTGTVTILRGNGDGTFLSTTPIQVSDDVLSVAVGDFFGHGNKDLAVTNLGHQGASSSVSVLRGNGDGTFGSPISFQFDGLPASVVAGDFFGDGKFSLAVSHSGNTVSVFRGNGDGTFQAPIRFLVESASSDPTTLVSGDFTGDGKLDLASTDFLTGDVSVLLNTSAPSAAAPAATATSLAIGPTSAVFGQSVTLTATVTSPGGTPTGTVTFRDGGTVLAEVAVDPNGQASLVMSFAAGSHSLTASFAGIAPFTSSTSTAVAETVTRAATTTTLVVEELDGPRVVSFTATVAPVAPRAGVPTGPVTFLDGSTVLATGTLDSNGQAFLFLETGLPVGSNSLTVSYGGDGNFQASTSAATVITVNAPAATATALTASTTSSVFGQPVTLTARVTSSGGTPTGSVAFFLDGAVAGLVPIDASGLATFTLAPNAGTHTSTAGFLGNSTFAASTSAGVTETVSKAATTTTLSASVNPVVTGKSVVFTAVVAAMAPGGGVPTGKVTFKDGNVVLGTATLDAGGKATLSTRFSTTGRHSITAIYTGDSDFVGSSQTITEQVNAAGSLKGTTTALVASANPIHGGQTVTFTATVNGALGTGTPTGSITFFVNNVAVGTVSLDASGKAHLTRQFSVKGRVTIRADYSGDSNFAASSGSLTEQVN
jgi:hypothetical protein